MDVVENVDRIPNMHILATAYAGLQSAVEVSVPLQEYSAEFFIFIERNDPFVNCHLFRKSREILFQAKSFSLKERLFRVPSTEISKDLIKKATQTLSLLSCTQEHHRCQPLLFEKLVV